METKENQKKLKKIRRTMNRCCYESLSVDRYTIEECNVESDVYLLMFVYNVKNEIIEGRIASYDDMVEIAEKIRRKSKIHISQCNAIAHYIAEEYDMRCIVNVIHYRKDILKVTLYYNQGIKIIQGTYSDIMNDLKYRKVIKHENR